MRHSYTRLNLFLACPAAYDHYANRETPRTESELLQVGAFTHDVFEAYMNHLNRRGLETDITEIVPIATRIYNETRAQYAKDCRPFFNELVLENVLYRLIEPFAASRTLNRDLFGGVEVKIAITRDLAACDWDHPDAWFRAKLDLLEFLDADVVRITDYKTGWNTEADVLQMRLYALLVMILYPAVREVQVRFDYVRFNIQRDGVFYREADYEPILAQLRDYVKRIESAKDFPCTPGGNCQWCNYAGHCDAVAIEPAAVMDIEQARSVVEAICLLERQLSDHKKNLKAWVSEHGNVVHNGVEWGFHTAGGLGFDSAEAFFHAAKKDGIKDPFEYMSVSREKTKKLRDKRTEEYSGHLAEVAVNQRSVRFEGKKAEK